MSAARQAGTSPHQAPPPPHHRLPAITAHTTRSPALLPHYPRPRPPAAAAAHLPAPVPAPLLPATPGGVRTPAATNGVVVVAPPASASLPLLLSPQ